MRGIIIEVSPLSKNTSIAHVRNCLKINSFLNWDIVSGDEQIKKICNKKYDKILFSYSSKFAPHKYIEHFLNKNLDAKLYWLINEYNGSIPKSLRDLGNVTVIANFNRFKNRDYDYVENWHNINLNTLISGNRFDVKKKYDLIYYGTYRNNREKYFKKYLKNNEIYLSSSAKNHKFFRKIGCDPKFIEKIGWKNNKETLRYFRYSLYIEDEITHSNYNYLANRFYESWFCGCIPLIDVSCMNTVNKSGFKIPGFCFIDSFESMIETTKKIDFFSRQNDFNKSVSEKILDESETTIKNLKKILLDG